VEAAAAAGMTTVLPSGANAICEFEAIFFFQGYSAGYVKLGIETQVAG